MFSIKLTLVEMCTTEVRSESVFQLTIYFSCMLLTIEADLELIITCLVPKSLCLGWSGKTGLSRNITTVMVFQNSTQIVTRQHLVCQGYVVNSWCTNINNCTLKLHVLHFPLDFAAIHSSHVCFISLLSLCCFNAFSLLCWPDGAAMRAGVQTGDRIIKVLSSFASMSLNC